MPVDLKFMPAYILLYYYYIISVYSFVVFPNVFYTHLRQSSAGLREPESSVRSIVLSRPGWTGCVLVVDHFVQSLQWPAVGASVDVQAAQQEQHGRAQHQLGPLDIRNTPSSHYDLHICNIRITTSGYPSSIMVYTMIKLYISSMRQPVAD